MTSVFTQSADVNGQSGSGGTETQVFCYDEQNRLVWAGTQGTAPGAGSGTCGSGAPASTFSGGSYGATYVATHLGQLWQGPLNGGSTQHQYLYCDSSHPHQLTGLYATGATCANKTGMVYSSSYDAWGNVTSRSYNGTTAALSYDALDHLLEWNAGASSQEFYVYDASGQRVLKRSTDSTGTTMTAYAFGLEEHLYTGTGINQNNTYYYSLGGRLIGLSKTSGGTSYLVTDPLGSVLSNFSNGAGTAHIQGIQLYSPYGKQRYSPGAMTTSKGFTGQYTDVLTELDYYNARYYDPKVGLFLSADTVQGNSAGMDPYAYVGNNPETLSDPSGQAYTLPHPGGGGCGSNSGGGCSSGSSNDGSSNDGSSNGSGHGGGGGYRKPPPQKDNSGGGFWGFVGNVATTVLDATTGIPSMINDVQTIFDGSKSWQDKLLAGGDLLLNAGMDALALTGVGELVDIGIRAGIHLAEHIGADLVEHAAADAVEHAVADTAEHIVADTAQHTASSTADHTAADTMQHAACSFTFLTQVATDHGQQAIGTLHVGTKVLAYNPKTHTMEQEPVLHVWVHSDNDLIDLTITTATKGQHGTPAHSTSEVIHTNQKHPFLTIEKGFLPVGQIVLGMHVRRANGKIGVITGWKVVPGAKTMYNLEVAQDHTFTVGDGQWVVHNCAGRVRPDHIPSKGVLNDLWDKGYSMSKHFVDRFNARGKGVSTQDMINVLTKGSSYMRDGDTFLSITGKTADKDARALTVVVNQFEGNELHSLVDRNFPQSDFTYITNPFEPEP